jgi:hypothetical protein
VLRNIKAAYSSWWAQIGIVLSAVSVFSYLARVATLPLANVVQGLLTVFRTLFHPIANLVDLIIPIDLNVAQKDLVILWLVIGGSVARTFIAADARAAKRDPWSVPFALLMPIAWPIGVVSILFKPDHFIETRSSRSPDVVDFGANFEFVGDLRVVLAVQFATVVAAVVAFVLVNAALL